MINELIYAYLTFIGINLTEQVNCISMILGFGILLAMMMIVLGGLFGVEINAIIGFIVMGMGIFLFIGIMTFGHGYIVYINDLRPTDITSSYSFNQSEFQSIASLESQNEQPSQLSGEFVLGSGEITGNSITTEYYTYYKSMGNDEFIFDKLPKDGVIIKEDGNPNPRIEWIFEHDISTRTVYKDTNESVGGIESKTLLKTYIHVPKGTIIKDYKL